MSQKYSAIRRGINAGLLPATGLLLLVLQNFASITLQHNVQSRTLSEGGYNPLVGIVLVEVAKFMISVASHSITRQRAAPQDISPPHAMRQRDAALPAALFIMATIMQSYGVYYLDLVPYLALAQLKAYIFRMATGIVLSQLGTSSQASSTFDFSSSTPLFLGATSMILAGFAVALGSICVEKALKKAPSVLEYNVQLSVYSMTFALFYYCWLSRLQFPYFFLGSNTLVILYLALQVTGGFLVAWCVAVTSTVTKNYAQGLGFALAVTVPLICGRGHVNIQVLIGISMVLISVLGSAFLGGKPSGATENPTREKATDV
ncbi:hypothetical protein BJX64DRAFT_293271 [Aspergillus heterothallicus]